jgi:hypothetical protein
MWNLIAVLGVSPLLVFGLYHLMTWFNIAGVNQRVYWKRVALASAVSHVLLTTGFFLFVYAEYRSNVFTSLTSGYGEFLFERSAFWRLSAVFDTAATAFILGLFSLFEGIGVAPPGVVPLTIGIIYVVGTAQWFFVGGGVGALLERFWTGLKTTDEEEWFQ